MTRVHHFSNSPGITESEKVGSRSVSDHLIQPLGLANVPVSAIVLCTSCVLVVFICMKLPRGWCSNPRPGMQVIMTVSDGRRPSVWCACEDGAGGGGGRMVGQPRQRCGSKEWLSLGGGAGVQRGGIAGS